MTITLEIFLAAVHLNGQSSNLAQGGKLVTWFEQSVRNQFRKSVSPNILLVDMFYFFFQLTYIMHTNAQSTGTSIWNHIQFHQLCNYASRSSCKSPRWSHAVLIALSSQYAWSTCRFSRFKCLSKLWHTAHKLMDLLLCVENIENTRFREKVRVDIKNLLKNQKL